MRAPLSRAEVLRPSAAIASFGDPQSPADLLVLLQLLYDVGRRDLPMGRLLEGHVDALQIVHRYGSPAQAECAAEAARGGRLFGVWNADQLDDPTLLVAGLLSGGKAFASGAGLVTDALISVDVEGRRQLILLDLDLVRPTLDRSWWRVTGMKRSETHMARWADQPVAKGALIGAPGDYVREPHFGGGAIRFAAVQAGGIAALADLVRDHLVGAKRGDDPFQRVRLADLHRHAQAAADAVRGAALGWSNIDVPGTVARVAAARNAVYSAGEAALSLASAAVGVQAMFDDHPLSTAMRDLDAYLRQPGPDAQRLLAGKAVLEGVLAAAL
ncbi:acyl-CoA dehydrogenase [uncultured Sphingomonas sp.]|uniref:acyl-CoA dehydrogenase n=1 Tax=uncultured Sphingomonas sp. TaxID=158754 RepID=UPI0035CB7FD2